MRRRKFAFGVLIVVALVTWDIGLPGGRASSTGSSAVTLPKIALPTEAAVPKIPGVIQAKGTPEWSATFKGTSLDKSVWSTCYPQFKQTGCQNFSNSKIEGEWFLPSQDRVYGGLLHLVAQRKVTQGTTRYGAPKTYSCRSGMVTSHPGFSFKYGYLQVVASIPTGKGLWPALWLAASNLQWPPEMDIVEAWGQNHHYSNFFASTYFHYRGTSGPSEIHAPIKPASSAMGWHTFALSWSKTQLTWLVDGKVILTTHTDIPRQKMYFIADLAESISPKAPTVDPGECDGSMLIKSIKLWKP